MVKIINGDNKGVKKVNAILMIFPVERGLKELIDWGYTDFDFFTDFPWWCSLAVHFLSFWIGEEVKCYKQRHEQKNTSR